MTQGGKIQVPEKTDFFLPEGSLETVRDLVKAGAEIDARSKVGITPLFYAVDHDYDEVVKALMGAGADPCVTDSHGGTAEEYAKQVGAARSVKLLNQQCE